MRFLISIVLGACFVITNANAQLQSVHTVDDAIGALVSLSFRLGYESETYLNPLKQKVDSLNDKKLSAYYNFVYKAWQRYFVARSPAEKEKLSAGIDAIHKNSPYNDLRAHILYWKGITTIFHTRQNETEALSLVLKGKRLLEELHYEKFPYVAAYYISLADVYAYFGDAKSAVQYTEKLLSLPVAPLFARHSQYNNIGVFYTRLNEYSKAEEAFKKGVAFCRQNNIIAFGAMIQGNIGNLHRLRGDYRQALPYLYESVEKTVKEIPEDAALSKLYLADCLLHLDSVKKAAGFLQKPGFEIPYWSQPAYNLTWFHTQAFYHQKAGNLSLALVYKDSLIALKDSVRAVRDNKTITVLESSLQAERFAAERAALEADRYWRNIIIVLLTVTAVVVVLLLMLRHRAEKKHEAQKRLRAEEALAHANERLNQYLASIREKNALIDQIRQQLDEANTGAEMVTEPEKAQYLQSLQNSELFTEEDWERFKAVFEQVFPGFFTRLLQQHPGLTPAEIRLLALEELELSDREKGAMLNISADSIKKARYRLRKKYPDLLTAIS